tara:strand:- start:534 stop:704 length:171 start_codon:yes stop_codon:yes gene_type:complete
MKEPKKYITRQEVADRFRCSIQKVDAERKNGNLKAYGLGRKVLFLASEVDVILTEL